jgi:hypothetical protein
MPLGQRLTQMAPEGRGRIRDLGGELRVGAGNVLSEVKARKVRAPAFAACVGDLTEDAGEFVQGCRLLPMASAVASSSRTGTSSREAIALSRCSSTRSLTARCPRAG